MIISNILCHIIHRCSRSNIGDHRGLLGHSFICVAADILTMQNNFFHSLNIGKIARIANIVLIVLIKTPLLLVSQQKISQKMVKISHTKVFDLKLSRRSQ